MRLEILELADCAGAALLRQRIAEAAAAEAVDVEVTHRVLDTDSAAREPRMSGSPTLLIDGHDPFTGPNAPAVACRLYPADSGGVDRAPSVRALRAALTR